MYPDQLTRYKRFRKSKTCYYLGKILIVPLVVFMFGGLVFIFALLLYDVELNTQIMDSISDRLLGLIFTLVTVSFILGVILYLGADPPIKRAQPETLLLSTSDPFEILEALQKGIYGYPVSFCSQAIHENAVVTYGSIWKYYHSYKAAVVFIYAKKYDHIYLNALLDLYIRKAIENLPLRTGQIPSERYWALNIIICMEKSDDTYDDVLTQRFETGTLGQTLYSFVNLSDQTLSFQAGKGPVHNQLSKGIKRLFSSVLSSQNSNIYGETSNND